MNLNNILKQNIPFQHWEFNDCLDKQSLDEISYAEIPGGERAHDGTRAADDSGKGLDGKLRLFVTKENSNFFPHLTKIINYLQNQNIVTKMSKLLKKDLSSSFIRLEIISDKKGFWLKPHKDISEKLMTMMIWANPYNESETLGTDLYDSEFKLVKTIKYIHNNGYFFSSGSDTWHGLELKQIKKERRCIQINYVSFQTEWPTNL